MTYDAHTDFAALVATELSSEPEAARAAQPEPAPVDEWLARRLHGFGASEMGALAVALGRPLAESDTKKLAEDARLLFARKAVAKLPRITAAKARARAKAREQERAVLDAWIAADCPGVPIVHESVRHASDIPEQWLPLRDALCHRLTCTPDAWAFDLFGELVEVSIKTTWHPYREGGLPWAHELQSQAACAVTCAAYGVVVTGIGYAGGERAGLVVDVVARDETKIAELREMVREGWRRVEAIKGGV